MRILYLAGYELLRIVRQPSVLISLIGVPLLLIFILGSALSSFFVPEDRELDPVRVAVVMLDQGALAGQTQAFLSSPEIAEAVRPVNVSDRNRALEMVKKNDADFAVVVPEDFSEKVLSGQSVQWEFILGGNRLGNLVAQSVFQAYLDQANLIQSASMSGVHEQELRTAMVPSDAPLIEAGRLHKEKKEVNAFGYYSAHMLVMFMLYGGMSAAISLISERECNTLERLRSMPMGANAIFGGKLFAILIMCAVQALVIVTFSGLAYGVDWSASWSALLFGILFMIVSSISLAVIVASYLKTIKGAVGAFNFLIVVMTLLSGGFSPDIGSVLESLGRYTLNYWSSAGMLSLMLGDAAKAWEQISILGCIALGLLLASITVYRKAGYHA